MQQPGWYPDPSGEPNQERYWDGQSWSTVVRPAGGVTNAAGAPGGWSPTGMYNPQNPPPPVGGPQQAAPAWSAPPPKRRVGWVIGVVALVLATAALALFIWRPWNPRVPVETETPEPTAPTTAPVTPQPSGSQSGGPQPTPSGTATAEPTGTVELNCAAGTGVQGEKLPQYAAYGLSYSKPDDWGWRYDRSQWTWLNEQAVWGKKEGNQFSGVALGGIREDQGFTKDKATEQYVKCLTSYGPFADGTMSPGKAEPTTLAGMNAQRLTMTYEGEGEKTWLTLYVVDTGTRGAWATLLAFAPDDPAKIKVVEDVVKTAKPA